MRDEHADEHLGHGRDRLTDCRQSGLRDLGENAGRVISANEFLTRVNLMGGDRFPDIDTPVGIGKDVVVIGAGVSGTFLLLIAILNLVVLLDILKVWRQARAAMVGGCKLLIPAR